MTTALDRQRQLMPAIRRAFNARFWFLLDARCKWSCEAADVHDAVAKLLAELTRRDRERKPEDALHTLYLVSLSGEPCTWATVPIGPGFRQATPEVQRVVRKVLSEKYPNTWQDALESSDDESFDKWFEQSYTSQRPAVGDES